MFNTRDVMKRFKVSRPTVGALVRRGVLPPPIKIGRIVRWREEDILAVERRLAGAANEEGGN